VLPFAIEHAEAHPDEVRRLYEEASTQQFADPASKARNLERILATYATDSKRSGPGLAASAGGGAHAVEQALYALKWLIPLLLVAAGCWLAGASWRFGGAGHPADAPGRAVSGERMRKGSG